VEFGLKPAADKPFWSLIEARDDEVAVALTGPCPLPLHCRQMTVPAPHHSICYRPDALHYAQPTVSKH